MGSFVSAVSPGEGGGFWFEDERQGVEPWSPNGVREDSGRSRTRAEFKPSDGPSLERDKSSASRQVMSGGRHSPNVSGGGG